MAKQNWQFIQLNAFMLKTASMTMTAVLASISEHKAITEQPEHKDQKLRLRFKVME